MDSVIDNRPVSPGGSTCTAPISEPAWLKLAGKALREERGQVQKQTKNETIAEEAAGGEATDEVGAVPTDDVGGNGAKETEVEVVVTEVVVDTEVAAEAAEAAEAAAEAAEVAEVAEAGAAGAAEVADASLVDAIKVSVDLKDVDAIPEVQPIAQGTAGAGKVPETNPDLSHIVERLHELTAQLQAVERRLDDLACNDAASSFRAPSLRTLNHQSIVDSKRNIFPLDVLKGKGGRHFLPSSRSIFMTYFDAVRQRGRSNL